jgi:hypothetical protein
MQETRVWKSVDGTPVSCVEKLRVLDQNLDEFRALALDFLEDAVLMGCDEAQVRAILRQALDNLDVRYTPR